MQDIDRRCMLALKRLTDRVSCGASLDEVLNFVYDEFQEVIPYERIGFAEITPDGDHVVARWARSNRELRLSKGFSAPLAGSSLQLLLKLNQPRVLNDLQEYLRNHPQSQSTKHIVEEGFCSSFTCPLVVEGKPVGFLFFTSSEPNAYSCNHASVYEQIAGQLSLELLITQERDRSRKTLSATVALLMSLLEMLNPAACGQATRVRQIVRSLTKTLDMNNAWEVELAALLCHLGCLTLPAQIMDRRIKKESLTDHEHELLADCTDTSYKLLTKIPHFKGLAEIVRRQDNNFDSDSAGDESVRFAANVLRAAIDFDAFRMQGMASHGALSEMRRNESAYAPEILATLESTLDSPAHTVVHRDVNISELAPGMRLEQHITTEAGTRLISSGHIVTDALLHRLWHAAKADKINEPIAVEITLPAVESKSGGDIADDCHALDVVS